MEPCEGCSKMTQRLMLCPVCAERGRHSPFCSQECFASHWIPHSRVHAVLKAPSKRVANCTEESEPLTNINANQSAGVTSTTASLFSETSSASPSWTAFTESNTSYNKHDETMRANVLRSSELASSTSSPYASALTHPHSSKSTGTHLPSSNLNLRVFPPPHPVSNSRLAPSPYVPPKRSWSFTRFLKQQFRYRQKTSQCSSALSLLLKILCFFLLLGMIVYILKLGAQNLEFRKNKAYESAVNINSNPSSLPSENNKYADYIPETQLPNVTNASPVHVANFNQIDTNTLISQTDKVEIFNRLEKMEKQLESYIHSVVEFQAELITLQSNIASLNSSFHLLSPNSNTQESIQISERNFPTLSDKFIHSHGQHEVNANKEVTQQRATNEPLSNPIWASTDTERMAPVSPSQRYENPPKVSPIGVPSSHHEMWRNTV